MPSRCTCNLRALDFFPSNKTLIGCQETDNVNGEIKFPQFQVHGFWRTLGRVFTFIFQPFFWIFLPLFVIPLVFYEFSNFLGFDFTDIPKDDTADFQEVLKSLSATFGILISLLFTTALTRYKESKRLYSALCGDVKALAMWSSTLSDDLKKYKTRASTDGGTQITGTKVDVELTFARVRLLLSVVAPVAKHVLRQAPNDDDKPDLYKLDDKYRVKMIKVNDGPALDFWQDEPKMKCCPTRFNDFWFEIFGYTKYKQVFTSAFLADNQPNPIKRALGRKIEDVANKSGMDLFEVVMYCLLDEINDLLTLKVVSQGNERDLIAKWQHIYNSWGSLMTYTIYKPPQVVEIALSLTLITYTVFVPIFVVDNDGVNVKDMGFWPFDWNSDIWGRLLLCWGYVLPLTTFWWLGLAIQSPFRKNVLVDEEVSEEGHATQRQVSQLLSNRVKIDQQGLRQYNLKFGYDIDIGDIGVNKQEEYANKEKSIVTINARKRRGAVAVLPPERVQVKLVKYKNVNF